MSVQTEGLIHFYTGDGKGKTTAAVGLSVRAAGSGKRVLFSQFLKDGSSSEIAVLRAVPGITVLSEPRHFGFFSRLDEEKKEAARAVWRAYFRMVTEASRNAELLVMDEFSAAYQLGVIDREEALSFLRTKPAALEIVLTGRGMPEEAAELCSYITEMKKEKHPFDQGITAREGIEF